MIALLKENLAELTNLCRRFGIGKLDVFGSAATGAYIHGKSDIDFVIEFVDEDPVIANHLFDFAESAEMLLGTRVDIIFESGMTNPYLRYAVNQTREAIFDERPNRQTAA